MKRIAGLDGLRGMAILLVMALHSGDYFAFAKRFTQFGWIGVDLFFALSGFLITGILLDTKEVPNYFRGFYTRRSLRIFPLYFSVLGAAFILCSLNHWHQFYVPGSTEWKFYFSYTMNLHSIFYWRPVNILGHFWSLCVEEQFYLVWPLLVWKFRPKSIARLCLVGLASALTARIVWVMIAGPQIAIVVFTPTRVDGLLTGALAALAIRGEVPLPPRNALLYTYILCPLLFLLGRNHKVFVFTFGFSILAIGFATAVLHTALWKSQVFTAEPLVILGKYSYGLYVFHVPILWLCLYPNPTITRAVLSWCLIAVVAWASFEYFEAPILALKNSTQNRSIPLLKRQPIPASYSE